MKVVYVEYLLLDNFAMNILLLWAAVKLCGQKVKLWRLGLGGFVGAVYAVLSILPMLAFLQSLYLKLILSFVMPIIVIKAQGWRERFKAWAYFMGVSFISGGIVMGLLYLTNAGRVVNGSFYLDAVPLRILFLGILIVIAMTRCAQKWKMAQKNMDHQMVDVQFNYSFNKIKVRTLLDTGSSLYDPITFAPVMVVAYKKLCEIFPDEIVQALTAEEGKEYMASKALSKMHIENCLIPYSSVGKKEGCLVGIRLFDVMISGRKGVSPMPQLILCATKSDFSEYQYEAILPPIVYGSHLHTERKGIKAWYQEVLTRSSSYN